MAPWLRLPFLFVIFFCLNAKVKAQPTIIPEPVSLKPTGGTSTASSVSIQVAGDTREAEAVMKAFIPEWVSLTGQKLTFTVGTANTPDPAEGYHLDIDANSIRITAQDGPGLFYALQTLKQLPTANKLPCLQIVDYPRYSFRGMHLDVSRHFFSIAFIKRYLDILAAYKLNTFQWHLTDSHGWRIEIKKYPLLTSIGAWRADRTGIPTTIAKPTAIGEPATYGGFYTQDQIRDVIAYAAKRYISIIPEIEIPGHCDAALVAYPEFSDLDNPSPLLRPCGYPGDLTHNLCLGYEPSFAFVEDILTEVMALFPSPFVHIGGDEVRGGPWLSCSRCRQRMTENGFTTAKQYQNWFTHRIDSFINAHGKRMIGWDEVLAADITPSAAAVAWHNQAAAIQALKMGHDMVMAPYHYTYFDFYQSDPRLEPDITYAGLGIDTVYAFEPTPPGLSPEQEKHVLGGEACLWTENFTTPERVEYMLLPRLLALAEVLWSPAGKKDYPRFIKKTEAHFMRLKAAGFDYATSMYNVAIKPEYLPGEHAIKITLADQTHLYPIRYTLDGQLPTSHSAQYQTPLLIKQSALLRTAVFKDDQLVGKANEDRLTIGPATGASIRLSSDTSEQTHAVAPDEAVKLVDGIHGTIEPYDGRWFISHDSVLTILVDLKSSKHIHGLSIGCMEDQVTDMFLPRTIEVAASTDGQHFNAIFRETTTTLPTELIRHVKHYGKNGLTADARYLRFTFINANLSTTQQKNQFVIDELDVN